MEIALAPEILTYSGGLGMLAGDAVRSAADLDISLVAVTLVSRAGYFHQTIDSEGEQHELPDAWDPAVHAVRLNARACVEIEERTVWLSAWLYVVECAPGTRVPAILLDTDLPENAPEDRQLTHTLYGGDTDYRLKQELILGVGGVRMLGTLGLRIRHYHMHEGHSALLILELLRRFVSQLFRACGHKRRTRRHLDRATIRGLYDRHVPRWRHEPEILIRVERCLTDESVWNAHQQAKLTLLTEISNLSVNLDPARPIISFARRMTTYKWPDFLFADLERLSEWANELPFQLVLAGKANPRDAPGKELIRLIHSHLRALAPKVISAFVPNYDTRIAKLLVEGSDVWLNTPQPPHDASLRCRRISALTVAIGPIAA